MLLLKQAPIDGNISIGAAVASKPNQKVIIVNNVKYRAALKVDVERHHKHVNTNSM